MGGHLEIRSHAWQHACETIVAQLADLGLQAGNFKFSKFQTKFYSFSNHKIVAPRPYSFQKMITEYGRGAIILWLKM